MQLLQFLGPLNLDGFMFTEAWQSGKKRLVMSRLVANFTGCENDNSKFEGEFDRVIKALRANEEPQEKPPVLIPV